VKEDILEQIVDDYLQAREAARTAANLASAHSDIADAHWRAAGHLSNYPGEKVGFKSLYL